MKKLEIILNEKVTDNRPAGGGCIANARILETESGKQYFLKSYSNTYHSIFKFYDAIEGLYLQYNTAYYKCLSLTLF